MGEAQRPLSTRPARLGQCTLFVALLLAVSCGSASAAEPGPAPEPPSQTTHASAPSPGGPQPEAPPQAAQPSHTSPETSPVTPTEVAPVEEAPHVSVAAGAAPTHTSARHQRHARAHAKKSRAAKRRSSAHRRKAGHAHRVSTAVVGQTLSATPSQHDHTLFVLAAGALGLLSLASLTLQRLLVQLARVSDRGHAT
jgi:hypothetical protein